jgi:Zn-dependent protease
MYSQFSRKEVLSIIAAWAVLSVAVSYSSILNQEGNLAIEIETLVAASIATCTAFILHELGHKFVALRRGYTAHFQLWTWGIALAVVTVVLSGGRLFFGAPGAVYILPGAAAGAYGYGYFSSNFKRTDAARENMIISAAGPGINLAFAAFFFLLYELTTGYFLGLVAIFGLELNVVLGSFNMLPIPPLDGSKVFRNNIALALALALPLWAMFVYIYFIL